MFAGRYFAPRFFAPRYFPELGAAVAVDGIYFAPRYFAAEAFAPRYFPGIPGATSPPPPPAAEVFGSGGQPWWLGRKPYRVKRREQDLRDALLQRNRAIPVERTTDAEDTPDRTPAAPGLPIATTLERLLAQASTQPDVILPRPLPRIAPTHLIIDDHEELRLMALLA